MENAGIAEACLVQDSYVLAGWDAGADGRAPSAAHVSLLTRVSVCAAAGGGAGGGGREAH